MLRTVTIAGAASLVAADSWRSMVLGDWGGASTAPYTTQVQLDTAKAMGTVGAGFLPQLIYGVGDNFYEDGISCSGDRSRNCKMDATSHRFVDTFENVYTAASLQVPWYINAGNHDWHAVANTTAELAYSTYAGRKSNRWTFPNFYYTTAQMFQDDAGNTVTVETVMIDTVIACGLTVPHANGQPIPRSNDVEEGSNPIPSGATEWAWIEKTLAASTADVLLVSGHYPVYSIAEHGSTDCLVKQLQPLLVKNKVAMYFGGHDHNMQWTDDGTGTMYMVAGAGHDYDNSNAHANTVPAGSSKFFAAPSTGGFATLMISNKTEVSVHMYDGSGKRIFETVFPNPRA